MELPADYEGHDLPEDFVLVTLFDGKRYVVVTGQATKSDPLHASIVRPNLRLIIGGHA